MDLIHPLKKTSSWKIMILKEPDNLNTDDKYLKAGHSAEKQMAFYLQRAFANEDMIAVLNGIRIQTENDVCQIDHLIIHEYGMIIVESKSVTSKVKINDDGSWQRLWNNHYEGMRSPVIQAQMQADFLRTYLESYKDKLLRKVLGIQQSFKKMPIDILVAISDKGRIDRSKHPESKFVLKADQVTGKIKDIYNEQKKLDNPLAMSLKMPDWIFKKATIPQIAEFLIEQHCPVEQTTEAKIEYQQEEPQQEAPTVKEEHADYGIKMQTSTCPECGQQMEILWGAKYKNYYWKCKSCGKNVSTYVKCPQCQDKLKIRKEKNKYFLYCEACNIEGLYHEELK